MADRTGLQAKVEQRQKELEQALAAEGSQDQADGRSNGLKAELRVASDALQGGWDQVSEVAAEELSRWLESTKVMVLAAKDPSAPKDHAPKDHAPKDHVPKHHVQKEQAPKLPEPKPKAHEAKAHRAKP